MELDTKDLNKDFVNAEKRRSDTQHIEKRSAPSFFHYDYLILSALARDIEKLVSRAAQNKASEKKALDLGSATSPYKNILTRHGYTVTTFDSDPDSGATVIGNVESTELPDNSFDLILCTQVLEHVPSPDKVMIEIRRILKPDGHLVLGLPFVWFYHPCPYDLWRFTQEGVIKLCNDAELKPVTLLSQGGCARNFFQIANFLLYGALGKFGAPLYVLTNLLGSLLDPVIKNNLFSMNFTCLAKKNS